jgi:hypothetical protein
LNPTASERSRPPDPPRKPGARNAGAIALAALLLGGLGWLLLREGDAPALVNQAGSAIDRETTPAPPPTPDPEIAAPDPEKVNTSQFDEALKLAGQVRVRDRTKKATEFKPIHSLIGRVVDDRDESPVYHFQLWLIPQDAGDPLAAKKTYSPSHMRNGVLRLDQQQAGQYNLIVESREHEAVVRTIEIPYESGELLVRLRHGTSVRGVVRDSFQQAVPNVDVQLDFDPARIDSGFTPPVQRISKTDSQGRYFFWKLPPGTYALRATLFGDVLAQEPEFRLDQGTEVARDFMIDAFGALRVVVTNPVDQPLARVKATLYATLDDGRDRVIRNGISDLKGVARLEFVKEGSYKLKVSSAGFVPWEQMVVVAAGDFSRDIQVRLEIAPRSGG